MTTNPIKCWDFTLAVYHGDDVVESKQVCEILDALCALYVFQHEVGEDSGYHHFQGRFRLVDRKRFSALIKCFPWNWIQLRPTCEKVVKDNDWNYVNKGWTRVDGPWAKGVELKVIPWQSVIKEYRAWQRKVLDSRLAMDSRTVNFIYDPVGQIGKSTFAIHCAVNGLGLQIPALDTMDKLMGFVYCIGVSKLYLIDLPRAIQQFKMQELYTAIESIKNGYVYDWRNKAKVRYFDSPAIWVFGNTLPDMKLLSADRWKIWTVDNATYDLVPWGVAHETKGIEDTPKIADIIECVYNEDSDDEPYKGLCIKCHQSDSETCWKMCWDCCESLPICEKCGSRFYISCEDCLQIAMDNL